MPSTATSPGRSCDQRRTAARMCTLPSFFRALILGEAHPCGFRPLSPLGDVDDHAISFAEAGELGSFEGRGVDEYVSFATTLLHRSAGGRSERHLVRGQAKRTYSGRPSSSMRFST
jgi:hypothetical protein